MGKVVRVGGRGTSRKVIEKPEDKWTGEQYREYQKKKKEASKDVYVTIVRGKASGEKVNRILKKKIQDYLNKK